jgi:hypothetical protein
MRLPHTGFELKDVNMKQTDENELRPSSFVHDIRHPYQRSVTKTTLEINLTFEADSDSLVHWNSLTSKQKQDKIRDYFEYLRCKQEIDT